LKFDYRFEVEFGRTEKAKKLREIGQWRLWVLFNANKTFKYLLSTAFFAIENLMKNNSISISNGCPYGG
jgi:hypothetical protein